VTLEVPAGLAEQAGLGADWSSWLDRLPTLAVSVLDDWRLERDGDETWHGFASLVLPVLTHTGERAVLKITFDGDDESLHEGLALRHWAGRGTVRLLRADPGRRALLLERLDRRDLRSLPDLEACEVVARAYPVLHRRAPPQLRSVRDHLAGWLAAFGAAGPDVPLPRRMVDQALSLGRDLVADPASAGVVVHGDLHYENVLASDDGAWTVIDPKPMSGDPHYEPAPMLWNRWAEVVASGDARSAVRRRFHTLVDVADLDEDRARDWVVVRSVVNAHWSVQDAARGDRALTAEERAWVTTCLTVAKAVQE
jgi:streptomycin 6-kinase